MFYFFHKIVFRLYKERDDDIRSAYVYLNFFHETVNSHNLGTASHTAHVIFVHHKAMKTHLKNNQNAPTIQLNSFFML